MSEVTETVDSTNTETQQSSDSSGNNGMLRDLQAERSKRQALKADYDALVSANEEAAKKQLEAQEKYKELYEAEQLKTAELSPIVEQYKADNEARKSVLLEKLGDDADDFKELGVPALEKVVEKLTKLNPPPRDPGNPGQRKGGAEFGGYESKSELARAYARKEPEAIKAWNRLQGRA